MSLTEPQTITINTVAHTLPRVSVGANGSVYQKDDGTVKLTVNHAYGRRNRSTIRVDHSKVSTDPLQPSINKPFSLSVQLILDRPVGGYTNVEIKQIADGLIGLLTASTGQIVTKALGGES